MRRQSNSAYPRVISNLGGMSDTPEMMVGMNMIRFMNHYARTLKERKLIIEFFKRDGHVPARYNPDPNSATVAKPFQDLPETCQAFKSQSGKMGTKALMGMMYDYFATGYANTLGFAHANTGDTMTSVMIGGLRTVMNGDFEIFAGDLVQFYWCFEKDDFTPDGHRKPYLDIWNGNTPYNVDPSTTEKSLSPSVKRDAHGRESWVVRPDSQLRRTYNDLSYGQRPEKMKILAKIKPYMPDEENPRLNDWYRVFGTAISSARPNEMCDIKISRQSM